MPEEVPGDERDEWSSKQKQCRNCGSREFDDSIPSLDAVCQECGVVVSATPETADIVEKKRTDREQNKDWERYYTITNSTEQQVATAFESLELISESVCAPTELRERAAEIYASAALETVTDGHPSALVIAACLTVAGRENQTPIATGRVANAADVSPGSLRRMRRTVERECGIDSPPCLPEAYLGDLNRILHLDSETEAAARQLVSTIPRCSILGKNPSGFAAAALYLVADEEITQREVARAAAVTTETIRMRVKDCRELGENGLREGNKEGT